MSDAATQEVYSGMSSKADANGFIVVYPQGIATPGINFTHFNAFQLAGPEPDDVAFASAMLDALTVQLCVDQTRVFSTGFSNGGLMSVRLACSLSARIAAIAPVAGAYYPPLALDLNPGENCPDTTPRPVIAFHGTADTTYPYSGGPGGNSEFTLTFRLPLDDNTPAQDVISDWSAHNGCTSGRQESQVGTEVRLIKYDSCVGDATVELYAVDGGGHTWPGASDVPELGYTTHQISATDLMWTFFMAHPLVQGPVSSVGGISEPPDVRALPSVAASSHRVSIVGTFIACLAAAAAAMAARKLRA